MRVPRLGRTVGQVVSPLSLLALFATANVSLAPPAGASPNETVRRTLPGDQVAIRRK